MKTVHGDFEIDDDRGRIDFAVVHGWLTNSYWSPGISRQTLEIGANNSSLVVGAYHGREQVGFLRVISDRIRFAYFSDVFVAEQFRNHGAARAMVRFAIEHPDYRLISKWLLTTRNAQSLYRSVGFTSLPDPERYLVYGPVPAVKNQSV